MDVEADEFSVKWTGGLCLRVMMHTTASFWILMTCHHLTERPAPPIMRCVAVFVHFTGATKQVVFDLYSQHDVNVSNTTLNSSQFTDDCL